MRTRGMKKLAMTAGLMSFLCGGTIALADVPAALDRVPTTTQVVLSVRDLDSMRTKVHGLMDAVGIPMPAEGKEQVDAFMGTAGLNPKGSMAVTITLPNQGMGSEEPNIVVLMPVTDGAAFIKAWGGTGEGTSEVKMFGHDDTGYAKDIGGGYVAIGKTQEGVDKFDSKAGNKAAHSKALGAVGNRVADSADVVLIANFPQMKEQMQQGIQEMKDSMEGMAQMMPDGGEQLGSMIKLITSVTDAIIADGQSGIVGLGIDDKGVNLDFAANFKEGSESAQKFNAEGKASSMISSLPTGDFLFAAALDWSSPSVRSMVKAMNEASKGANPMGAVANLSQFVDDAEGYSFFLGAADLGAGLFANTGVVIPSKDPAKLMTHWKGMLAEMDGKVNEGVTFKTSCKEKAKTIAGIDACAFEMSFDVDANNPAAGQMQMVMPMIFGPEGKMQGYALTSDNATITTMSRNSALMERMIAANKAKNGFSSDALVQQTAERLPPNRFMESYIGMKSVMDLAQGAMAMFGAGAELQIPEHIAPVGMGAAMSGGGVQFRMHVPNDVIKAVTSTINQFQHHDDGGEPMEGGDEKPRF